MLLLLDGANLSSPIVVSAAALQARSSRTNSRSKCARQQKRKFVCMFFDESRAIRRGYDCDREAAVEGRVKKGMMRRPPVERPRVLKLIANFSLALLQCLRCRRKQ